MTNTRNPSRVPFAINAMTAGLLVVVLAAFSLLANPPAPPSIAEFSPQSQQQIEDAPDEQSAEAGASGTAGSRETVIIEESEAAATEAGPQEVIEIEGVPSALNCVTWPDGSVTQTFDPQSPPCVASWDSGTGNGGATAQGVTPTEIRVAVPVTEDGQSDALDTLIEHFNTSYQFYGRRLVVEPVPVPAWGNGAERDPELQRANAQAVLEVAPFAALEEVWGTVSERALYLETVAKGGVIALTGATATPFISRAQMREWSPFIYSFLPPADALLETMGQVVCRQLAGKPAAHSPSYSAIERSFAILKPAPSSNGGFEVPGVQTLLDQLATCGITDIPVQDYDDRSAPGDPGARAIYTQFALDGITTLLYIQHENFNWGGGPLAQASSAGYQPEWFVVSGGKDDDVGLAFVPPEQADHLFGILANNKQLPRLERFEIRAAEGSGAFTTYAALLPLAAGIQAAGPNLTPQTMAQGLARTAFPNPGHGAAPYFQAGVDLGATPWMIDDYAGVWYTKSRTHSSMGTPGSYCYLDRGTRWTGSTWPATDNYFDVTQSCR